MTSNDTDRNERSLALLGAASGKRESAGPCPTQANLDAFIANRLAQTERADMLSHLNRCNRCYQRWLKRTQEVETPAPTDAEGSIQDIRLFPVWKPALALATALIAALLLWRLPEPNLAERIDEQYAGLKSVPSPPITLPWENQAQSFHPSAPTPEQAAFGAGLWDGRKAHDRSDTSPMRPGFLATNSLQDWSTAPQAPYYQLGRWLYLILSSGAQASTTDAANAIIRSLEYELSASPASPQRSLALDMVSELRQPAAANTQAGRAQRHELLRLTHRLAP